MACDIEIIHDIHPRDIHTWSILSQYNCHVRSHKVFPFSQSIVAYIIIIPYVGLLDVMTPPKIEIIHMVPIVNHCICRQRVTRGALSVFTLFAGYHFRCIIFPPWNKACVSH